MSKLFTVATVDERGATHTKIVRSDNPEELQSKGATVASFRKNLKKIKSDDHSHLNLKIKTKEGGNHGL